MTTRSMSIIMTMTTGSMSIITTMTTRSMSIITTMTMRSMSIITTMIMKSMNIITTMIMNVAAAVDTTITIMRDTIMPMMYLQVGEKRQSVLIQKKRSEISSRPWRKMDLMAISFVQKVWLQVLMENGSISTWFRVSMK